MEQTPISQASNPLKGSPQWLDSVKFGSDGLVTAVALDHLTGDVLMLAHMNREALALSLQKGVMTYWSRSRKKLWLKGETSGNIQRIVETRLDCDGDALIFRVHSEGLGAACHEGFRSCFFRKWENGQWVVEGTPVTGWKSE